MTKHTTGPWRVTSAPEGRWIEVVGQHPTKAGWEEDVAQADGIANAARIVACVNALEGIEDPEAFVKAAAAMAAALRPGNGVTVERLLRDANCEHFGGDVDAYNAWVARHSGG